MKTSKTQITFRLMVVLIVGLFKTIPSHGMNSGSQPSDSYDLAMITSDLRPPDISQFEKLQLALKIAKKVEVVIFADDDSPQSISTSQHLWDILFQSVSDNELSKIDLYVLNSKDIRPLIAPSHFKKRSAWIVSPEIYWLAKLISAIRDEIHFSSLDIISSEGDESSMDLYEDVKCFDTPNQTLNFAEIKLKYYPNYSGYNSKSASRAIRLIKDGYKDIDWNQNLFEHYIKACFDKFFERVQKSLNHTHTLLKSGKTVESEQSIMLFKKSCDWQIFLLNQGHSNFSSKVAEDFGKPKLQFEDINDSTDEMSSESESASSNRNFYEVSNGVGESELCSFVLRNGRLDF